jgi:hypothetical protein
MKRLLAWPKAIRITWQIHRKTRHLPPRERQRVLLDVQTALYEGLKDTDG